MVGGWSLSVAIYLLLCLEQVTYRLIGWILGAGADCICYGAWCPLLYLRVSISTWLFSFPVSGSSSGGVNMEDFLVCISLSHRQMQWGGCGKNLIWNVLIAILLLRTLFSSSTRIWELTKSVESGHSLSQPCMMKLMVGYFVVESRHSKGTVVVFWGEAGQSQKVPGWPTLFM